MEESQEFNRVNPAIADFYPGLRFISSSGLDLVAWKDRGNWGAKISQAPELELKLIRHLP